MKLEAGLLRQSQLSTHERPLLSWCEPEEARESWLHTTLEGPSLHDGTRVLQGCDISGKWQTIDEPALGYAGPGTAEFPSRTGGNAAGGWNPEASAGCGP